MRGDVAGGLADAKRRVLAALPSHAALRAWLVTPALLQAARLEGQETSLDPARERGAARWGFWAEGNCDFVANRAGRRLVRRGFAPVYFCWGRAFDLTAHFWVEVAGPETGCGCDFFYERAGGATAWINVDQTHVAVHVGRGEDVELVRAGSHDPRDPEHDAVIGEFAKVEEVS